MGNFPSSGQEEKFPLKIRKVKKYGAIPDIPDQRDIYTNIPKNVEYYKFVDLRKTGLFPDIQNQGNMGSSVAHAILAVYIYNGGSKNLSPQFIYYNQRVINGTTLCDSGSSIRDGIKVLERLGTCREELYPYSIDFYKDRPTNEAYEDAYKNKQHIQYRKIKNSENSTMILITIMKSVSIKVPVIMAFTVYDSFEHQDVTRTGIMPLPKLGEKIVGYHAVVIVGYDLNKKYLLCRNNNGPLWGQGDIFGCLLVI